MLDNAPYTDKLPRHHLKSLLKIMCRAECSFEEIADHQVNSHLKNAKAFVPFKTMSFPSFSGKNHSVRYFGGIAFGSNVFLRCNTDADFTRALLRYFLKVETLTKPMMMSGFTSDFQRWVQRFHYVQETFCCLMH